MNPMWRNPVFSTAWMDKQRQGARGCGCRSDAEGLPHRTGSAQTTWADAFTGIHGQRKSLPPQRSHIRAGWPPSAHLGSLS